MWYKMLIHVLESTKLNLIVYINSTLNFYMINNIINWIRVDSVVAKMYTLSTNVVELSKRVTQPDLARPTTG